MHLTVAMGRPVVSVFGPTDPVWIGPYGRPRTGSPGGRGLLAVLPAPASGLPERSRLYDGSQRGDGGGTPGRIAGEPRGERRGISPSDLRSAAGLHRAACLFPTFAPDVPPGPSPTNLASSRARRPRRLAQGWRTQNRSRSRGHARHVRGIEELSEVFRPPPGPRPRVPRQPVQVDQADPTGPIRHAPRVFLLDVEVAQVESPCERGGGGAVRACRPRVRGQAALPFAERHRVEAAAAAGMASFRASMPVSSSTARKLWKRPHGPMYSPPATTRGTGSPSARALSR